MSTLTKIGSIAVLLLCTTGVISAQEFEGVYFYPEVLREQLIVFSPGNDLFELNGPIKYVKVTVVELNQEASSQTAAIEPVEYHFDEEKRLIRIEDSSDSVDGIWKYIYNNGYLSKIIGESYIQDQLLHRGEHSVVSIRNYPDDIRYITSSLPDYKRQHVETIQNQSGAILSTIRGGASERLTRYLFDERGNVNQINTLTHLNTTDATSRSETILQYNNRDQLSRYEFYSNSGELSYIIEYEYDDAGRLVSAYRQGVNHEPELRTEYEYTTHDPAGNWIMLEVLRYRHDELRERLLIEREITYWE